MKMFLRKWVIVVMICASVSVPQPARADFWGGDVVVLSQILVQAVQQLIALKKILSTGKDTLELMEDINRGISDALNLMRTVNSTLQPGQFGNINDPAQLMRTIQELYGAIPKTSEARTQMANDQGTAEAIMLHNQAFQYASQVDPEAERIKDQAKLASPQGAAKLTAQSMGMLIHVTNQVLRTNAAILKVLGQDLAMNNKREKLNSDHFRIQYEQMSRELGDLQGGFDLGGKK